MQECKKITAKVETYWRDLHICHDKFEILMAPAVTKAIQDTELATHTLPWTFPQHAPANNVAQGITPFTEKPPLYELVLNTTKHKTLTQAQKTLQALARELADSRVLLPSDYHVLICEHVGMKTTLKMERKLCKGLATEALDKLCLHLTMHKALEYRRQQVSGVINNTVVNKCLTKKRLTTDCAAYEYHKDRYLLRVLGMPEDHSKFKLLLDTNCYAFTVTTAEFRIGDSNQMPSWIWGDFSYIVKVKDGNIRKFLDNSECDRYT